MLSLHNTLTQNHTQYFKGVIPLGQEEFRVQSFMQDLPMRKH